MDPPISAHSAHSTNSAHNSTGIWARSPDDSISVNGEGEVGAGADTVPRKRRRKYIAKAW